MLEAEVERALSSTRAAREEIVALRERTRATRSALEWQRFRARKQLSHLHQTIEQLQVTLEMTPRRLEWTAPNGVLDDVLFPVE